MQFHTGTDREIETDYIGGHRQRVENIARCELLTYYVLNANILLEIQKVQFEITARIAGGCASSTKCYHHGI